MLDMSGRKRWRNQEIVEEFVSNDYTTLEILWGDLGYKHVGSARSAFAKLIDRMVIHHVENILKYDIYVSQVQDRLFLCKIGSMGVKDPLEKELVEAYNMDAKKPRYFSRDYFKAFIQSDDLIVRFPFKACDYADCASAACRVRSIISEPEFRDKIAVSKNRENIYIYKLNVKMEDYGFLFGNPED